MKKIIVIILGLLLCFSIAIAQDTMEKQPKGEQAQDTMTPSLSGEEGQKPMLISEKGNGSKDESKGNNTGPITIMNQTQVHAGLYNALGNVENAQARQALEQNMNRFMERYQERLQNYKNVTVEVDEETQEMTVRAKKEVKYLGFIKGSATEKIQIEKNGNMVEKKPWYRFMYAESQPEE